MVALDIAGAVIASLAVALIRIPKPEKDAETRSDTSFWIEMKEGYSIVKQDKSVVCSYLDCGSLYALILPDQCSFSADVP